MTIDETYIKTSEVAIKDILYDTLYNMSFLLTDKKGLMRDIEAKIITKNLNVSTTGDIIIDLPTIQSESVPLIARETFQPVLSDYGMEIYGKLPTLDPSYVYVNTYLGDIEYGLVFQYLDGVSDEAKTFMSYLYLELFSLLRAVVDYRAGDVLKMTVPEIEIISSNIRYIQDKIGNMGDDENTYALLYVLKLIQRSILFVKKGISSILR